MKLAKHMTALLGGAAFVTAGLLTAGAASAQTEVRWMHVEANPDYTAVWQEIVDSYNEANDDVNVEMQFLENEAFKARLPTLLQSDAAPHFFYSWGGGVLRAQSETGILRNLTDVMGDDDWQAEFNPASLDGLTFDGEVWAVPLKLGTVSFFYNREMFEEAGVDADDLTDWEAFLGAVEQLKDAGFTPISAGGGDAWPVHFYWSYLAMRIGGQDVVDNAKIGEGEGFLDPAFVRAGEELARLGELDPFQPGYLGATWPEALGTFGDGNAAMILSFENTEGQQRNNAADGVGIATENLGRFAFPAVEGGAGAVTDTLGALNGWAVHANAPDEAIDFLKYFSSEENQRKQAAAGMLIPAALGAEDGIEDDLLREASDQLAASTWHQNYFDQDFGPAVGRVINDISVEIVSGNMDPETATQMLQDEFDLQ